MRHIEPPFQVSLSLADNWEIISDQQKHFFPNEFPPKTQDAFHLETVKLKQSGKLLVTLHVQTMLRVKILNWGPSYVNYLTEYN